jgi:hypothetical protein
MTAFDNNVQQTRAALLKMARSVLHKQLGMNISTLHQTTDLLDWQESSVATGHGNL